MKKPRPYGEVKPKQFGDMHERMKYLIQEAQREEDQIPVGLWHAIWDLQTEVQNHVAIQPPFGKRIMRPKRASKSTPE